MSPGFSPTSCVAGTRLSEQPIHRYRGVCCCASELKNCGSEALISSSHCLFFSKNSRKSSIMFTISDRRSQIPDNSRSQITELPDRSYLGSGVWDLRSAEIFLKPGPRINQVD